MINERQKPYQTTQEEQLLRWSYAKGKITKTEYNKQYKRLRERGLIRRNGRIIK